MLNRSAIRAGSIAFESTELNAARPYTIGPRRPRTNCLLATLVVVALLRECAERARR